MEAHTNLNTFGTVVAMLEGGTLYGNCDASGKRSASRIIHICKQEMRRQLVRMDRATGRNGGDTT